MDSGYGLVACAERCHCAGDKSTMTERCDAFSIVTTSGLALTKTAPASLSGTLPQGPQTKYKKKSPRSVGVILGLLERLK